MLFHPGHLIPEGKFKEIVKKTYRILVPHNFKEVKLENNVYRYDFKNGVSIKFHGSEFLDMSSPLRGYLKKGSPKLGDTVIDLGAFNGMFSIYASKIVGKNGKVYAFEPNPKNFEKMKANIKLNNIINIIPINGGLWNGETRLEMSDDTSLSSVLYNENNTNKISIKVMPLDTFIEKNKIKKVNFIKMDVEGAELEILEGSKKTISTMKPQFAIASYHIRNNEMTHKEVERILQRYGYRTTTGFPSHITTYGWKK